MSLAENLTRLQSEHGETNYRLAKAIDVTQTSVKSWKTGSRRPHPKHVKRIANHYDVTVEELMKEE